MVSVSANLIVHFLSRCFSHCRIRASKPNLKVYYVMIRAHYSVQGPWLAARLSCTTLLTAHMCRLDWDEERISYGLLGERLVGSVA